MEKINRFFRLHTYKRLFTKLLSPFVKLKTINDPILFMTLYVRDEEDIIEDNLKFHHAMGIDGFIVTDNGSKDSTLEILRKYERLGWIKEIIINPSTNHPQDICVDKMIRLAKNKYHADWIINADADEFWWSPLKNLKKALEEYHKSNIVFVNLFNVLPEDGKNRKDWDKMVFSPIKNWEQEGLSKYSLYAPNIPKVIHRTEFYRKIFRGNHQVQMLFEKKCIASNIFIYHYPIRSYSHFERKVIRGGIAYSNNSNKNLGIHWRYWYSLYLQGQLLDEYKKTVSIEHFDDFLSKNVLGTDKAYLDFVKDIVE